MPEGNKHKSSSTQRSSLKGRETAITNQTNIRTVWKIRPTLKLFEWQCWENVWETGWEETGWRLSSEQISLYWPVLCVEYWPPPQSLHCQWSPWSCMPMERSAARDTLPTWCCCFCTQTQSPDSLLLLPVIKVTAFGHRRLKAKQGQGQSTMENYLSEKKRCLLCFCFNIQKKAWFWWLLRFFSFLWPLNFWLHGFLSRSPPPPFLFFFFSQ